MFDKLPITQTVMPDCHAGLSIAVSRVGHCCLRARLHIIHLSSHYIKLHYTRKLQWKYTIVYINTEMKKYFFTQNFKTINLLVKSTLMCINYIN